MRKGAYKKAKSNPFIRPARKFTHIFPLSPANLPTFRRHSPQIRPPFAATPGKFTHIFPLSPANSPTFRRRHRQIPPTHATNRLPSTHACRRNSKAPPPPAASYLFSPPFCILPSTSFIALLRWDPVPRSLSFFRGEKWTFLSRRNSRKTTSPRW